jgi:hypothetical protein
MNPAYKHLDAKLRFAGLTLGQWAGVIVSLGSAIAWGEVLHPLSGTLNTVSAVYIGGIPGVAAWVMAEAEIDVLMRVRALARWRRGEDRYLPGASEEIGGYALRERVSRHAVGEPFDERQSGASLGALWE